MTTQTSVLRPVVPYVRATDFKLARQCEFLYYLKRRLGLTSPLTVSEALTAGTWLHACMELQYRDAVADSELKDASTDTLAEAFDKRSQEIKVYGEAFNVGPATIYEVHQVEARLYHQAVSWWRLLSNFRVHTDPYLKGGFNHFLSSGVWQPIAVEMQYVEPEGIRAGQFDMLLVNLKTKKLWVLDLKSTEHTCRQRLEVCPIEFGTWHYMRLAESFLAEYGKKGKDIPVLDGVVEVGGVIHLAVQKPPLKYGSADRLYSLEATSKRSGLSGSAVRDGTGWLIKVWATDTGEERYAGNRPSEEEAAELLKEQVGVKPQKKADGEPSLERYIQRCEDWAMGVGEYADKAEERRAEPPVMLSFTHNAQTELAKRARRNAEQITGYLHSLSVSQKPGDQWMMSDDGMWEWGKPTAFAPFYIAPMKSWPELVGSQRLVVSHRNAPRLESADEPVLTKESA